MASIDNYKNDSKADARIEEKRRRNAERRAARTGANAGKTGAGTKKQAPKKSVKKTKLILFGVIALVVLVLIIRLIVFIGSTSMHHLNDEGLKHAERFSNSLKVHGIDVSSYQDEINWKKAKSSEADFAFIRAGYRSAKTGELNEDKTFEKNMKAADKAGVMKGVYFYSQALNAKEAEEEAEYLLELVKPYNIE